MQLINRRQQYYQDNKEREKEKHKEWLEKNPEYMRKWQEENSEHLKEYRKQCYVDMKEYHRKYMNYKRKTDLKYSFNNRISRAIAKALKGNKNGRRWENLVGYSLDDLVKHLKKTIPKNYNWQDYLNGKLHVDHKIPISAFNYTKSEHPDFKKCWMLSNLQLLPITENLKKHNKLSRPFQPALCLEME